MIAAYGSCVALVIDFRDPHAIFVRVCPGYRSLLYEKTVEKSDAIRKTNGIILVNVRGFCRLHSIIIQIATSKSGEPQ